MFSLSRTNELAEPVITIESGVAITRTATTRTGRPVSPIRGACRKALSAMDVGDSFLVPHALVNQNSEKAHSVLYTDAKRFSITVTVRKTDDGFRCWRVK